MKIDNKLRALQVSQLNPGDAFQVGQHAPIYILLDLVAVAQTHDLPAARTLTFCACVETGVVRTVGMTTEVYRVNATIVAEGA